MQIKLSSNSLQKTFTSIFRLCVTSCVRSVCNGQFEEFLPIHGYLDKLTNWVCLDQCQYDCMWKTVALFHRNKKRTPQFFGKWPFIRIFGMQEPAAAIFSMMNLFAHVHLLRRFHQKIPSDAPMRNVWIIYGFVSINAWVSINYTFLQTVRKMNTVPLLNKPYENGVTLKEQNLF